MVSEPPSQSEETGKRNPPPRRPAIVRIFRALKRYEDHRRRRREKEASETDLIMARWTRRVGLFTLALVGVGIVTGGIFLRQLNVMQDQLDEMRDEQRPWLVISNISVSQIKFDQSSSVDITFTYTLKNLGKSPATIVRPRYQTLDSVDFIAIEAAAAGLEEGLRDDSSQKYGSIIAPQQEKTFEKLTVGMSISKEATKEQALFPTLFICVLYNATAFREPRSIVEVFRLYRGENGKTGLTTEFLNPRIWFSDLAAPLKYVRLAPIDQLERAN
jgi:hypothetical protein